MIAITPSASVQYADDEDTEELQLISRARKAVSASAWEVGEVAELWTERFAKGRTDADFGELIGMSDKSVGQRRRAWVAFRNSPLREQLHWGHFRAAITWDDAAEILQWAADTKAKIREMVAYRRAIHGEDLTTPAADEYDGPQTIEEVLGASTDPNGIEEPEDKSKRERDEELIHYSPTSGEGKKQEETDSRDVEPGSSRPLKTPVSPAAGEHPHTLQPPTTKPTRQMIEDFLNGLSVKDLGEAFLAIEGDAKDKAAYLRELADELDPQEEEKAPEPVAGEDELLASWNTEMGLQSRITPKRRIAYRVRLKDPYWRDNWEEALTRAANGGFAMGENKLGWKMDLDFFLKPDTVTKIMEGSYVNNPGTGLASFAQQREDRNADALDQAVAFLDSKVDQDTVLDDETARLDAASGGYLDLDTKNVPF